MVEFVEIGGKGKRWWWKACAVELEVQLALVQFSLGSVGREKVLRGGVDSLSDVLVACTVR